MGLDALAASDYCNQQRGDDGAVLVLLEQSGAEIKSDMDESEALKILEGMTDAQFNAFLQTLPERTQMLVRSRMCDWKKVLPAWYIKVCEQHSTLATG